MTKLLMFEVNVKNVIVCRIKYYFTPGLTTVKDQCEVTEVCRLDISKYGFGF